MSNSGHHDREVQILGASAHDNRRLSVDNLYAERSANENYIVTTNIHTTFDLPESGTLSFSKFHQIAASISSSLHTSAARLIVPNRLE